MQLFCIKDSVKVFCDYILGLNFFGARILAQINSLNIGEFDHRKKIKIKKNRILQNDGNDDTCLLEEGAL